MTTPTPAQPGATGRPRTILVWQVGALGDTLLAYPALQALRRWAPAAAITVLGRPSYLTFARWLGLATAVLHADGAGAGSLPLPDLAVLWSAGAQRMADGLLAQGAQAILHAPARPDTPRHQARYLLDCLRPLGIPQVLRAVPVPPFPGGDGSRAPCPPPLSGSDGMAAVAARRGHGPLVLLHPGAGSTWKRWPLSSYTHLAGLLQARGATVHWSFGEADDDLRAVLLRSAATADASIWPPLDLEGVAHALAACDLLVSADCGVAHLAALFGVPQVTLFGPTDPRRWRPLSRAARIVQAPPLCGGTWELREMHGATDLSLRRCNPDTGALCRCLQSLDPPTVSATCLRLLGL